MNYLLAAVLVGLLALSAGCVSPARSKAMTPAGFRLPTTHPYSVILRVQGGLETDRDFGVSEISSHEFREALIAAMQATQVFSSIRDVPPADYRLLVSIVRSKWKGMLTVRGTVATRWQLTRLSDGKTIHDEFIETSAKSVFSDTPIGIKRIQIAKERAAQENIKVGLKKVAALRLD